MKAETTEQAAKILGVTEAQARAQYAFNAVQLREMAKLAGAGVYRGKTAAEWLAIAEHAERLAQ